jgi:rhomboid family GlyGly-CTERM serine protease
MGFSTILQAFASRPPLEYRRIEVLHGQVWRLFTASFVHLGWNHLARDSAGLILIWALLADSMTVRSWIFVIAMGDLSVGLGLLVFSPNVMWYVGISGVLFGMYTAGALADFQSRRLYSGALLFGMILTIAWSLYAGSLPGETVGLGGRVVPQAHLYGAVGGSLTLLAKRPFTRLRQKMRIDSRCCIFRP